MIYIYLIPAILTLTAGHLFQTFRWKQFISIYEKPNDRILLQSLSLGYILNFYLPFRIGDLFRSVFAGKNMKNGIPFSLATVILGRFLDILFVGTLFIVYIFSGNFQKTIIDSAIFYCSIIIILLIFTFTFLKYNSFPKWSIRKFAGIFNPRIELQILIFFWCFISSFKDMYLKTNRWKLLLNTFLMWFFYITSYYLLTVTLNQIQAEQIQFIDVFLILFAKGNIDIGHAIINLLEISKTTIIILSFLFSPLILIMIFSFFYKKNNIIAENQIKYFNLLPHKNKEDKLAFLEVYFSSHDSSIIHKYLDITKEILVLEDFSAGSNATTLLCYDNNRNFYRKYLIGKEKDKLYLQILWLKQAKNIIPVTRILQEKITDDYCFYDMEYDPKSIDLFRFIHSTPVNSSWKLIKEILDSMRLNLHLQHKSIAPEIHIDEYIENKIQRNIKKLKEQKLLKDILSYDELIINGKIYKNLTFFFPYFQKQHLTSIFNNDEYCEIHGDLTIENIIVNENSEKGFYLIDPNPGNIHNTDCLDFAKLLQSLHGGYEFLMKTSQITVEDNKISYTSTRSTTYEELLSKYKAYMKEHFSDEKIKSIFYHEIVHWLRLMPYKFEKNGERALLFYSGFIIILNEIIDEFEKR